MKNFFKDDSNRLSMGRLLSFITCLTGLAIGIIVAIKGNANSSLTNISLGFVSIGIAGKVISKIKEK